MNVDELRQKAKSAGIKSWHLKKPKSLEKELAELEEAPIDEGQQTEEDQEQIETPDEAIQEPEKELQIIVNKVDLQFFKAIGLKPDWLVGLASKYGFTKFQYMAKFKAFRCFIGEKNLDWIDINDNGGQIYG